MKINLVIARRLMKVAHCIPGLFLGYNIFVDSDKIQLLDRVYQSAYPSAKSFVDLGGVWKVNAAYSLYTLRKYPLNQGILVDTDYPSGLQEKLSHIPHLHVIHGDFTSEHVIKSIGSIDVAYFFDVLLHQANPSWDQVLSRYSSLASCIVIYDQQYVRGQTSVRLTHLPLEEYLAMTHSPEEISRFAYAHANELDPKYKKPWIDFQNIIQWGITDDDLRATMVNLGFREVYYQNCGPFLNLPAFENHEFIFLRDRTHTPPLVQDKQAGI